MVDTLKNLTLKDIGSSVSPQEAAKIIEEEGSLAGPFQRSAVIPRWERDVIEFRGLPLGEKRFLREARDKARLEKTYLG